MSRSYPERPIVGVGVVVWRGNSVLLVKRGKPPRVGSWSLPGGAQKVGETVFEAAIREVREETSLEISVTGLIDVVDSIHRDSQDRIEYHYTLVDVAALSEHGDATALDDATDVGWFTRDELAPLDLWSETVRIIDLSRSSVHGTLDSSTNRPV